MTDGDPQDGTEREGTDGDRPPQPEPIEPAAPSDFGRVQIWWGNGKGKTTAALGMGLRAVGHGFRVHMLQFMKGGAPGVEPVRGEYNAIAQVPGYTYENVGHYGWHTPTDESDAAHAADARAGLERARGLLEAASRPDLATPFSLDSSPDEGVHLLVLDEILYAANRGLIDPDAVVDLVETKPADLELVLTGGHEPPDYLGDRPDLIANVQKVTHHFDDGVTGRRGTEY
ncbi:cob(I)yrinic acid a,c-diamide adenosyltransferase [Halanaeroarchaeum sulfurireducens]|uniref:ATP:corrinoid adenosyltransferase BtuR/CobO/CobP n=1 Tax=Halanaeroarchaeum sulfurireducens TaxID=1604004 RepID=A0A0N9N951_9EURY|nr:cob(I)yrinic acid a,c-diamide adenosyltransferase [Halanaeroarchaeum sulfurireducens]ALG81913.1 ATP:corrinoid adenosyltransferase BtuR/CobO/CobP [Halanaeroarchaeum sulfurireducens]